MSKLTGNPDITPLQYHHPPTPYRQFTFRLPGGGTDPDFQRVKINPLTQCKIPMPLYKTRCKIPIPHKWKAKFI